MTYCAGLDVSLKETKLCVLAPGGRIVALGGAGLRPFAKGLYLA